MGGSINRKQWTFEIVEFTNDGDILPIRTVQFQSTDRRTGELYLPASRDNPASTIEPIAERSWEFQAVLYAIPKLQIANYRYKTDAVSGSRNAPGMGWTLPAAAYSMIVAIVGAIMLAVGRRTRGVVPITAG